MTRSLLGWLCILGFVVLAMWLADILHWSGLIGEAMQ